jgi:hypothetical protein
MLSAHFRRHVGGAKREPTRRVTPEPDAENRRHPLEPSSAAAGSARPSLSLVVPAYNEATRLEEGVQRLLSAAANGAFDLASTEILLVDDGSTDATVALGHRLLDHLPNARVLVRPHAGKGAAVRAGVAAATAPRLAYLDADMSIYPWQLLDLVGALDGADIAVGSRTLADSKDESESLRRTIMGRVFNRMVNLVTHVGLGDTQCGFKGFRTPVAQLLFHLGTVDRYAFDVEVLWLARRLGCTITQVPVHWAHVGGSRVRPIADPLSMVLDVGRGRLDPRRTRPVPALSLVTGGNADLLGDVRAVLGPNVLLVPGGDRSTLALFPLAASPQVDVARARLAALMPSTPPTRRLVSLDQLLKLAPLRG